MWAMGHVKMERDSHCKLDKFWIKYLVPYRKGDIYVTIRVAVSIYQCIFKRKIYGKYVRKTQSTITYVYKNIQMPVKCFSGFTFIRCTKGQKIRPFVYLYEFFVTLMDLMKYTVFDVLKAEIPNSFSRKTVKK